MAEMQPRLNTPWGAGPMPMAPQTPRPGQATAQGSTIAAPTGAPTIAPPSAPAPPPEDIATVGAAKGKAIPVVTFDSTPPAWSAATKAQIRRGFQTGMQQTGITTQELNSLLKQFGISRMVINEQNIQDPAYNDEVRHIQTELGKILNHPDLRAFGQGHAVPVDGQFSKSTVQALAGLRDSLRGEPIQLKVTPLKQETGTGCYRTAEAMMFNVIHGKDGTAEAYTEFDTRGRVKEQDLDKTDVNVTRSEDGNGRITVNHDQAMISLDKIDEELESGRPVIAGVSYRKQDGVEYNEGITDHYVLISGRGRDAAGPFYTFQDPAQGGTSKLRLDPMTGRLSGRGDMTGIYDVSMIQTASRTDKETTERYRQMGKVMFTQGQSSREIQSMQLMLTAMGKDTKGATGGYGNGTAAAVKAFQAEHNLPVTGGSVDSHTLKAIQAAFGDFQRAEPDKVMFKRGQSSPMLVPVQKALTKAGFNTHGAIGAFGQGTEKALKDFQKAHQLPETGTLDNRTWLMILGQ